MFDNIGGKIKSWAERIFTIQVIVSIVGGIIIFGLHVGLPALLLSLLVIVIGVFSAWLSFLFLYAFGQLVENSDEIVRLMEDKNPYTISNDTSKETQPSTIDEPKEKKLAPLPTWKPVDEADAIYVGETNVKCNNCDCVQFKGNRKCTRCGAKFVSYQN